MMISLILATLGRSEEVKRFLEQLDNQIYRNFELIVIDQNHDDFLKDILLPYQKHFPIIHVRVNKKGVSRARNLGLSYSKGEIVTFPDDDCWYPKDLLGKIRDFFFNNPKYDGLAGRAIDPDGISSVGRWDVHSGVIDLYNEWVRSSESSIFVRKEVIVQIGGFDETLGPGAGTPWGAHEGDDLVIRAIKRGFQFYYDPKITIYHPHPIQHFNEDAFRRGWNYACGMGWVLHKHSYPIWFVVYYWLRSVAGALLSLIKGDIYKAKYYWVTLKGRIWGWVKYK